jgi:hypothetical protein
VLCACWNLGTINIYFPSSWLKISSRHFSTLHVVMLWLIKSWTKGDSTFVQLVFHVPAFVQSVFLGGYLSLYNTILILSANNIFYVTPEASSFSLQGCSIYIKKKNTKKQKKVSTTLVARKENYEMLSSLIFFFLTRNIRTSLCVPQLISGLTFVWDLSNYTYSYKRIYIKIKLLKLSFFIGFRILTCYQRKTRG